MRLKLLLVGCGDIGTHLAAELDPERFHCFGLRRNPDALPAGITGIAHDLNREKGWDEILTHQFDALVLTLVPGERGDAGYYRAYVRNLQYLLTALAPRDHQPRAILFASSSAVYGQNHGEWVDETSTTEPERFNGRRLLEAEAALAASPVNAGTSTCAVRFAGIYGPGRQRLLRQVKNGSWNPADTTYTNRIHVEDCAGVLRLLLERVFADEHIPSTLVAADSAPAPRNEVMAWLAQQLGAPQPAQQNPTSGGKRCSNRRLLALGYRLRYPTYRDGYRAMLEHSKG